MPISIATTAVLVEADDAEGLDAGTDMGSLDENELRS
jgi:hypothetical protein